LPQKTHQTASDKKISSWWAHENYPGNGGHVAPLVLLLFGGEAIIDDSKFFSRGHTMAKSVSVNHKRRKSKRHHGKGAIDIIEEAVHLIRTSSPTVLGLYYIGSLPFILALLYFWTDMIRSAFADRHCAEASLGLAILFIWMKSWQSVFIQRLLTTHIRGIPAFRWSLRRIGRLVVTQTIIQPWGMLVLPMALLLTFPFPWAYAFFQNVMVFGDGEDSTINTVLKRSWQQAKLWPKQNVFLIWLLSPWLLVIASVLVLVLIPFFSAAIPGTRSMLLYLAFCYSSFH
jgi:hypothetical protein